MTLGVPSLRRGIAVVLTLGAVAATALIWARVVQTISNAEPPVSTVRPTSIVWHDRVFESKGQLERWLRSRGATYRAWSRAHPRASADLERRPLRATPVRRHRREAPVPEAAPKRLPVAAPKRVPAARAAASSSFPFERIVVTLLAVLAVACAWAASMPAALRVRYPLVAERLAPRRDVLLAGAAALVIGILAGVALN